MSRFQSFCLAAAALLLTVFGTPVDAGTAGVQVLAPEPTISDTSLADLVGMHIKRRLLECRQVDVVQSDRGRRLNRYFSSDAFVLTEAERWQRITRLIDIDGMLSVETTVVPGKGRGAGSIEIAAVMLSNGGQTRAVRRINVQRRGYDAQLPRVVAELAAEVGAQLGLDADDIETLGALRVKDVNAFVTIETVHISPKLVSAKNLLGYFETLNPDDAASRTPEHDMAALRIAESACQVKSAKRNQVAVNNFYYLGRAALFHVLGTPAETAAYPFATLDVKEFKPIVGLAAEMRALLREVADPLRYGKTIRNHPPAFRGFGELDDLNNRDPFEDVAALTDPTPVSAATGVLNFSDAARAGAIRILGLMGDTDTLEILADTARRDDPRVRQATAFALSGYAESTSEALLDELLTDTDESVKFTAARSLWLRGDEPDVLMSLALKMLDGKGRERDWAADLLVRQSDDVALLERLAADPVASVRGMARRRLAATDTVAADVMPLLRHPDEAVAVNAITRLPAEPSAKVTRVLHALTDDVTQEVAWAARDALSRARPTDEPAATRFDLATAHFMVRHRIVRALEEGPQPWATDVLVETCRNTEPHTRALALRSLAKRAPDRAAAALIAALTDEHLYVRLCTAALLATHATLPQATAIATAMTQQQDAATLLYLEDALARAEGRPLPAARPAARSVAGERNLAWLCPDGGKGDGGLDSPYDAYYQFSTKVTEGWKKVYENTQKIFISRATPIANPGPIMVDPVAQDSFWLTLDTQLGEDNVPWIDGVVYGEETMSMGSGACWRDGWRVFCDDASIDHTMVNGDINNLTDAQRDAFRAWGMRRAVEGFNRLYDYTKLKYGKLKPGFQVATFLGEQGLWEGPNVADFDWKFDIGGVYHYYGDSRKNAYALVRRYQTIWPDRPVIWLSHGIGLYQVNPVRYTHKAPLEPIRNRHIRAYLDAVNCYIAGADTGWFSIWGFVDKDWGRFGPETFKAAQVIPEQIRPEDPKPLERAINYAFRGVVEMLVLEDNIDAEAAEELAIPDSAENEELFDAIDNLDDVPEDFERSQEVDGRKREMFLGFQFYRRFLYDIARLMSALPRNRYHAESLVIHPIRNVWYGALDSPGADLPNLFDFLIDINKVRQIDLSRYRYITVQQPEQLEDATIGALDDWLKQTPGVLYVHIDLTADNARERGTLTDHDGQLERDWPWEGDVETQPGIASVGKGAALAVETSTGTVSMPRESVASTFAVSDAAHVSVLARVNDQPVVVLWRYPDGRGAVLFDGLRGHRLEHTSWLRDRLNELADAKDGSAVGRHFGQAIRQLRIDQDAFGVAVSNHSPEHGKALEGVESITGEPSPVNPGSTYASVVLRHLRSRHVAADNGVTVIAEKPLERFDAIGDGVIVRTGHTFRAVSTTGALSITNEDGTALPAVDRDRMRDWLVFGHEPGVVQLPSRRAKDESSVYFVRGSGAVNLRPIAVRQDQQND